MIARHLLVVTMMICSLQFVRNFVLHIGGGGSVSMGSGFNSLLGGSGDMPCGEIKNKKIAVKWSFLVNILIIWSNYR